MLLVVNVPKALSFAQCATKNGGALWPAHEIRLGIQGSHHTTVVVGGTMVVVVLLVTGVSESTWRQPKEESIRMREGRGGGL